MKTPLIAPMFYGAKPKLFEFAKRMRFAPTDTEKLMWGILSSEEFRPYKFRRQHPISRFIADFYSHKLLLVIEVDGGYHLQHEQKEYDAFRDEDMQLLGLRVLRFTSEEISRETEKSKIKLINAIDQIKSG